MRLLLGSLQRMYACMIVLLMTAAGYAQELSGIVRDENGNGVEFANVVLMSADSTFINVSAFPPVLKEVCLDIGSLFKIII